jgi:hypothetical protein
MRDQIECVKNLAIHMQRELAEIIERCDRAMVMETGVQTANKPTTPCRKRGTCECHGFEERSCLGIRQPCFE